ncbi:MAG: MarR family winged helix-turn-helix transcriptional regulator [Geodermatophilaceae bacterium]
MSDRPANLRLDDQLCFALYAATNAVTRAYRPLLEQIGLTYPQYLVMLVLWQDGAHAVHEIAARLALPAHALSPLLARLERAGLVTRRRSSSDHRVVRVRLTAVGADLEAAAGRAQRDVACQTQLDPAALAELREELHELVARMSPLPITPSATSTTVQGEAS